MTRPRLAWFTPLPPVKSGIATYSAELLPLLAESYAIDVFVERLQPTFDHLNRRSELRQRDGEPGGLAVREAHDFVWLHAQRPYDLVVFQMGNEMCHDYMWAYLVRYPGLVVLHDGHLHHARAGALLARGRIEDYREELTFCHPDAPAAAARVGGMGLLGHLQYFWPMRRVPVTAARAVAVHSPWLAADLREEVPEVPVHVIRMGVGDPWERVPPPHAASKNRERDGWEVSDEAAPALPSHELEATRSDVHAMRARYNVPSDAVVFAVFGRLTPEKRIGPAMRAVAGLVARGIRAYLLLLGEPVRYYALEEETKRYGVADWVRIAGHVKEEELPAALAAADVCLCLRWPTSRETSAAWLRCLAAGKPTVVTDLSHTVHVPALDPRDWSLLPAALAPDPCLDNRGQPSARPDPPGGASVAAWPFASHPVTIAIDILDEDHSLALALDRLANDAHLRASLGTAARAYFEANHTFAHMAEDYRRVIEQVRTQGQPDRAVCAAWPAHLQQGWTARARALLAEVGVSVDFLDD